jgi:hypothetical protein
MVEKKSAISYESIMKDLKARKYSPVYVLMGEEPFYIDKICDYISENVLQPEERDFNQTVVFGADVTGAQVAAMCFLFTSAMTPIITREFSKSYEEKDFENMRKLFYRYIPMLYSIAAFFSVFISLQSENVLLIFTDEKFQGA